LVFFVWRGYFTNFLRKEKYTVGENKMRVPPPNRKNNIVKEIKTKNQRK
jgi:hypothetical protein